MSEMAKWREKNWEVSTEKVTAIENLSFAYEQKAENNKAAEGSPSTNERGMELFSLSFSCLLHSNAGVDVMNEIESWKSLVSKTGAFYLNGKQIGPKLQLRKVSVSNTMLDDLGRIRLATLSFVFEEYEKENAPAPKTNTALNVGAPTSSKEEKKPNNSQLNSAPTTTMGVGSVVKPTGTIPQISDRSQEISQIKGEKTLLVSTTGTKNWVQTNELTLV